MELMDKLIKMSERRILKKAAQLLVRNDQYDRYFFDECRELTDTPESKCVIKLGESYALAHTSGPIRDTYVRFQEIKHAEEGGSN